jgi:hypothetical protein
MEKPEQELARLEVLAPFEGSDLKPPIGATYEEQAHVTDVSSGGDDETEGVFGWDTIEDFLWVGQTME